MSIYTLFVTPGLSTADAVAAKKRYEGEDDRDDHLDQARIQSVVSALTREHELTFESEDDEESGSPRGVDLTAANDGSGPDVRVDGMGVCVTFHRADTEALTEERARRGVAVVRSACRLVQGVAYDPERDLVVDDLVVDDLVVEPELVRVIVDALSRPPVASPAVSALTSAVFKRARIAIIVMVLIPTVGTNLAGRYLRGFPLMLTMLLTMVVTGVALSRWVKRAGPQGPPAASRPEGVGNDPIGPR